MIRNSLFPEINYNVFCSLDIAWESPLCQDLVFAAYPVGNTFYDAVSREFADISPSGTVYIQQTNNGYWDGTNAVALALSGTTTVFSWPRSPLLRGAAMDANATILCLGGCASQSDGAVRYILSNVDDYATGAGFGLCIDNFYFAGNGNIAKNDGTGFIRGYTATQVLGTSFANKIHFFGYSCRNNGTDGTWFYRRIGEAFTGKTAHGSVTANRRAMVCGITTGQHLEMVCLGLMWSRELDVLEYQQLYDNPWQIFTLPPNIMAYDVKAAGVTPPGGDGNARGMWHVYI